MNYKAHGAGTGSQRKESFPSVFLRMPSSVVANDEAILRPRISGDLDFEGELAVVIGRAGRYIKREDALNYIMGYSCFNDASIRDWQRHNPGPTPGKNFYRCGSFGPWIITQDSMPGSGELHLQTRLNGEVVQDADTSTLIHDVPHIIEYLSGFTLLEPGDVIATGTPSGVGMTRTPPLWMKAGDVVEVEISHIGLRNQIEDETTRDAAGPRGRGLGEVVQCELTRQSRSSKRARRSTAPSSARSRRTWSKRWR